MEITLVGPPMAPPVELSRWLMARHGVAYRFLPRAAGLHALQQKRLGLPFELPILLTPEGPVGGLRPSLADLDARLRRRGDTLYRESADREWADRDWAEALMTPLFPAGVKSFYWHMLEAPAVLVPCATAGVPWYDRLAVRLGFSTWRKVMRGGLKLDEFDPAAAEATIAAKFDRIAAELGGRPWLGGAAPGFRDIVFAVMASPVTLPPGHPASLPAVADLPPMLRALVERSRAHPAGQHALKVYSGRDGVDCAGRQSV